MSGAIETNQEGNPRHYAFLDALRFVLALWAVIELIAALELLNFLIPRKATNATSRRFAPLRYTPGTRIFFSEHSRSGVHVFGGCFRTKSGVRT